MPRFRRLTTFLTFYIVIFEQVLSGQLQRALDRPCLYRPRVSRPLMPALLSALGPLSTYS
ncbi:hypothetical protein ALO83_104097 [Pseudomonas cannabina pv. alisalensis]|uniref:Uncharacterized protein n=1 Tax=Pseudomonas cannabina TaxID=86840 RepID=A0A3M3PS65_PSECA|nr:Unknown protein sequence [Pseudomonas syringae pv. maculicola]KPW25111.1 hypothetical protein ALO83_104097 [Pseudomonas cannabina pv. alisalensis]RMN74785.1 hypothetical protein ALQ53_103827 [Pseudomonas cannabina]RMN82477.1 hypothetical protein ALQ52_104845 [Pseudomonas cannabina pv. alisalensis]RMO05453.1 hypothetical protein ALQ51_102402 [Pseudomonas cannabina]